MIEGKDEGIFDRLRSGLRRSCRECELLEASLNDQKRLNEELRGMLLADDERREWQEHVRTVNARLAATEARIHAAATLLMEGFARECLEEYQRMEREAIKKKDQPFYPKRSAELAIAAVRRTREG